jgi:hypothetical protein
LKRVFQIIAIDATFLAPGVIRYVVSMFSVPLYGVHVDTVISMMRPQGVIITELDYICNHNSFEEWRLLGCYAAGLL